MTVANLPNLATFTGSGSAGPFSFLFDFYEDSEISVTVEDLSGNITTLNQNIDYTVSGANAGAGGSVTLTAALTAGYLLTVLRTLPLEQDTLLEDGGPFQASTIMEALDYLMMCIQQLQTEIDNINISSGGSPGTIDGGGA